MIKKTLILGLIVCSFLVSSTVSVVAAEGVIDDELDDVYDENYEYTSDTPNLDIDKITYKRDGQAVTLKLSVNEKGVIEDKGSLEVFRFLFDLEYMMQKLEEIENDPVLELEYIELLSEPLICYYFILQTKENEYNISYVNGEHLIKDLYSTDLVQGSANVNGNDLTISFDLLDSGDRLVNLTADAMELVELLETHIDEIAGDCVDVAASGSSGSSSKTPGFEIIAVIAAIAIAFIILRRKK